MTSPSADSRASLARRLVHYAHPRQLNLVTRIAELGAIQKAATALGMSQPSATQGLNRVEELLGLALFDRHARGVRLTREGALLMPSLKRALAAMEALGRDAANVQQGAHGLVRIAGIAAASTTVAAQALPELCAAHPDLWIDYREIDAAAIATLCQEEGADIVLCRASVEVPPGHAFTPLQQDRLGIYCASDHALAGRRTLNLRSCADETWLLPPEGSPPFTAFQHLCEQLGMRPALARIGTRSIPLSVAAVCRLKLLYVGPDSHMKPYVETGQLKRLPLQLPDALDAIGMLCSSTRRSDALQVAARHLTRWAGA